MIGNKNGYQASRTRLDIYNVRHIKIQSTGKNDFCLRIELCGEGESFSMSCAGFINKFLANLLTVFILVQSPSPVYDLQVISSYSSAELTWKIRTKPKDSSYITHYNISIDQKHPQRISRVKYGTKFTISGLKPNTSYCVEIKTADGSGQESGKVYKKFKTKQAGMSDNQR